jgi:hypothetical protein
MPRFVLGEHLRSRPPTGLLQASDAHPRKTEACFRDHRSSLADNPGVANNENGVRNGRFGRTNRIFPNDFKQ